jgi:hypothetical protein
VNRNQLYHPFTNVKFCRHCIHSLKAAVYYWRCSPCMSMRPCASCSCRALRSWACSYANQLQYGAVRSQYCLMMVPWGPKNVAVNNKNSVWVLIDCKTTFVVLTETLLCHIFVIHSRMHIVKTSTEGNSEMKGLRNTHYGCLWWNLKRWEPATAGLSHAVTVQCGRLRTGSSIACMFISAGTCLPIRYLALNYSGFQVSVTSILKVYGNTYMHTSLYAMALLFKTLRRTLQKLAVHWLRTTSLSVTIKDLHWGGARLEFRLRHLLSWLRLSVVSFSPSRRILGWYLH